MSDRLEVSEIFRSIQGESTRAGLPCSFIRLAGCDRSCRWCDTDYARSGGITMSIPEIIERVRELGTDLVEVTGGEPLIQESTPALLTTLADHGYTVLLETGGHRDIRPVDPRVIRVVDIKCPSSGEAESNLWMNLRYLRHDDEAKLVIASREDYEWARDVVRTHRLEQRCHVVFSPVFGEMQPSLLVSWIQEDRLAVRLGLQIHKYIWGANARGV